MTTVARQRGIWIWGVLALLSLAIAGYALFHVATGFAFVPAGVKQNGFPSPLGLEVHIAASAFALLTGPWQFLRGLRTRWPIVHRWTGRAYVLACTVGGLAGGSIAMFTTAGPVAGAGFFGLAVAWLVTTQLAWSAARRRDFVRHERWMVRSFALTLAAVTLRIELPLGAMLAQGDFLAAYRFIAWFCWVPNLVVAELWLRWFRRTPPPLRA